jgi:MFS family permease
MTKINYLEIIRRAWAITWSNKYLWWFGFFVALTSSTGNFLNFSNRQNSDNSQMGQHFLDFVDQHASLVIAGIIVAILIFIILLVLRLIGRGALIRSIEKNSNGEKADFSSGIKDGRKYFWKIFWISFLLQAAVMVIILLMVTPIVFLFATKSYILGGLLALAGFIIMIPLIILAFFMQNYSTIYVVLGDLSITEALENGYTLFRRNILSGILMALVFIPIGILVVTSALFLFFFLAIIFLVIGIIAFLIFSKIGAGIVLALAIILFLIIMLGLRSIYETFSQAVWILFFHEIAKPKVTETVSETIPEIEPAVTPGPAEC